MRASNFFLLYVVIFSSTLTAFQPPPPAEKIPKILRDDVYESKKIWSCASYFKQNPTDEGGTLEKHDRVTGRKSRLVELAFQEAHGRDFRSWASLGASRASCIFDEPKHDMVEHAPDGSKVVFTKADIAWLLAKTYSVHHALLPPRSMFESGAPHMSASEFSSTLEKWTLYRRPFTIDRVGEPVSIACDQVRWIITDAPPASFEEPLDKDFEWRFSTVRIRTEYGNELVYFFYEKLKGDVRELDWIVTKDSSALPEFMLLPIQGALEEIGDLDLSLISRLLRKAKCL